MEWVGSEKENRKKPKPLKIEPYIPKDHRITDFSTFLGLEVDFMPERPAKMVGIGLKIAERRFRSLA